MFRIIVSVLAAVGLAIASVSVATAEPEEGAPGIAARDACLATVNAAYAAAPAVIPTSNPAVVEINFDKYVNQNLGTLGCEIVKQQVLLALKIPGEDRAAQIAKTQAQIVTYTGLGNALPRCFRLAVGGGIFCGTSVGTPSEGL